MPRVGNTMIKPVRHGMRPDATKIDAQDHLPKTYGITTEEDVARNILDQSVRDQTKGTTSVTKMEGLRLTRDQIEPTERPVRDSTDAIVFDGPDKIMKPRRFKAKNSRSSVSFSLHDTMHAEVPQSKPEVVQRKPKIEPHVQNVPITLPEVENASYANELSAKSTVKNRNPSLAVQHKPTREEIEISPLIHADRLKLQHMAVNFYKEMGRQMTMEDAEVILRREAREKRHIEHQMQIQRDQQQAEIKAQKKELEARRRKLEARERQVQKQQEQINLNRGDNLNIAANAGANHIRRRPEISEQYVEKQHEQVNLNRGNIATNMGANHIRRRPEIGKQSIEKQHESVHSQKRIGLQNDTRRKPDSRAKFFEEQPSDVERMMRADSQVADLNRVRNAKTKKVAIAPEVPQLNSAHSLNGAQKVANGRARKLESQERSIQKAEVEVFNGTLGKKGGDVDVRGARKQDPTSKTIQSTMQFVSHDPMAREIELKTRKSKPTQAKTINRIDPGIVKSSKPKGKVMKRPSQNTRTADEDTDPAVGPPAQPRLRRQQIAPKIAVPDNREKPIDISKNPSVLYF